MGTQTQFSTETVRKYQLPLTIVQSILVISLIIQSIVLSFLCEHGIIILNNPLFWSCMITGISFFFIQIAYDGILYGDT